MALISFTEVCLAYGLNPLLDHVNFQLDAGERVCLIGRNGEGKSTLLKLVDGQVLADSGEVWKQPKLRIARLEQELPVNISAPVYDVVAGGLVGVGALLSEYHALSHAVVHTDAILNRMSEVQHAIDAVDGWSLDQRVQTIITRLELPAESCLSDLSGGWQRRVLLGRALVSDPEVLLLDEPTNHLDIEAITWLEEQLTSQFRGGVLFVTHDRALLARLATRIVALDRGQLTSYPCNYETYLVRKAALLEAEAKANAEFDKKLAQEEVWIRKGVEARRTRNEGRVRALQALRLERQARREMQGQVSFNLDDATRSGKLVLEAENISFSHVPTAGCEVNDFSIRILRGDRIGLIGANGVGKSTLLKLLLGELQPQQGTIKQGTKLAVAYFDQLRSDLDVERSVIDNVAQGSDFIEINGERRHVISYLQDFLFAPARARTPVKSLSGGERARLLLAKLFSQPANVLVLDEPTNDLDLETLDLLEELLAGFSGTILLVSHDRAFLDNVVTSCLVFKGAGHIEECVGGYSDWQRQVALRAQLPNKSSSQSPKIESKTTTVLPQTPSSASKKKLSYKDQRELDQLPEHIARLEALQADLTTQTSDVDFYQQSVAQQQPVLDQLVQVAAQLEAVYARWLELES